MKLNPILLAFWLIPLTGCGGGNDGSDATTSTYSIKAIDGYLRNAQIWLDVDGDYQLDDDEPSAITGEGGIAELNITEITTPEQYSIVTKAIAGQTIDEDTITATNPSGSVITTPFILSAPPGQKVISPFSSLIDIKMKGGKTQAQAVTEISAALGIDETEILNDYVESAQDGIAAKAKSLVLLGMLPESEEEIKALTNGTSNIDDILTESTLASLSSIVAGQLLVTGEEGTLTTINISNNTDANYDPDADGADKDDDGIINLLDSFPNDATETADTDNDGIGDNSDVFPNDPTETADTDNDGVGDNSDAFPNNATETTDTDNDGVGDNSDTFPNNATETVDTDNDGVGDNADVFPNDATETVDTDNDGIGDNTDVFPNDATETVDTDNDGVGDNADVFPNDATETVDTDNDGIGDNTDQDANGDGIIDIDEAGFEYADLENKRFYNVYVTENDTGNYFQVDTYLFGEPQEDVQFGYGYIDSGDNYLVDSIGWELTNGSLIIPNYNSRYKLIESASSYFKVCFSNDITADETCDTDSVSYLFFDKASAKSFVINNSSEGTEIILTDIEDSTLNAYFGALEYDYAEQVTTIDIGDFGVESLAGVTQFTSLKKLFAGDNHITDITPLNNFTSLRYLYLNDQSDADTGDDINLESYDPILTMTSLERLVISAIEAEYTDQIFDLSGFINNLVDKSTMTQLRLYSVQIENEDLAVITDMPNLEKLYIANSIRVVDFTALESNTWNNLEELDITWNNDDDVDNGGTLSEELVDIPIFNLDNMITAGLDLSQLVHLGLSQTTIDADDMLTIAQGVGENLEQLRLRKTTTGDYSSLFSELYTPNLTSLKLGNNIYKNGVYDLIYIEDNLTPTKLDTLYLQDGTISNFNISEFSNLEILRLKDSNITDTTLPEFKLAIQQLDNLEELDIRGLTIIGEAISCDDLELGSSIECDHDKLDEFTTSLISGQTWYTNEFFQLAFGENSTFIATSFINPEETDGSAITISIEDGKLILNDEEELQITDQDDEYYTLNLINTTDQTTEEIIAYTSLSAFEGSLATGLSEGITLVDSDHDSTNGDYAGFELESLTVIESNENLIITVTASGDILEALLSSSPPTGYSNIFWITINQYLDFGFGDHGVAWLDQDVWEDGEFLGGTLVPSSDYQYTVNDDTVTLTIPVSLIPENQYLAIKTEIGIDYNGAGNEAEDDMVYDKIYLGINR